MKNFTKYFLVILLLQWLTFGQAFSQLSDTVQIDFGNILTQVTGWNNVANTSLGTIVNLVNSKGNATGLTLSVTDAFNATNTNGAVATASLKIPATASGDSFYGNDVLFNGATEPTGAVKITNLDTSIQYSFSIFASRSGVTDNREAKYTLIGKSTVVVTLNASNNTSNTANVSNLLPASDGSITIKAEKGANNNNTSGFYYLGVVKMGFNAKIKTLTLTSPNGGEQLGGGTQANITWTTANITSLDIDFSSDNGLTWNVVASSVPASNNSYSWTVPSISSTNCLVRVKDHSNASINDASNAVFSILTKTLTLTSPNGGEQWGSGTQANITWTAANITSLDIDFSSDNGLTWNAVASSIPVSNNSYSWTVPSISSTNCLIRVKDHSDASINDASNAVFSILTKTLTLTSPNGGEQWVSGTQANITWTAANITSLDIDFSSDNGLTWNAVASSVPASNYSYSWTVSSISSTNCLIRVKDHSDASINDASNAVFSILTKTLTLTSPNGGEQWVSGQQANITWTETNITSLDIDFSSDNGLTWNAVASSVPASNNTYNWTVPSISSTNCLVRAKDHSDATVLDASNAIFDITIPAQQTGIADTIQIDFGNILTQVTGWNNVANTSLGTTVNLVNSKGNATGLTLSVTDAFNATNTNGAVASASLKIPATASGDSFYGNDVLFNGATEPTGAVKITNLDTSIQYSFSIFASRSGVTDNREAKYTLIGKSTVVVTLNASNNTSNTANVSNLLPASDGSITIKAEKGANNNNTSGFYYLGVVKMGFNAKIKTLTLTSPNGGEQLGGGTQANITWTAANITSLDIDFSSDNGLTWNAVASSVPASNNSYSWTIPSISSTNCLVQVKDHSDASINDASNAVFSIITASLSKTLALTSPNGGEQWVSGQQANITWTETNINSLDIDFSSDNGLTWNAVASSVPASDNTYNWIVPSISSTNCLVRAKDHSDATVLDASNTIFDISIPAQQTGIADTIQIDFGNNLTQITGWNNVTSPSLGTTVNLVNSKGNTTGLTLDVSDAFNAININGAVASASLKIPATASGDSFYGNDVLFNGATEPTGAVKIANLDTSILYSFSIFASRDGITDNREAKYTLIGKSTIVVTLDAANNTSNTASVSNLLPASDGSITLKAEKGPNNNNPYGFYYLGVVKMAYIGKIDTTKTLHLTSPNGGEIWEVGKQANINWTASNIASIDIDYSIDNGLNWNSVATSVPASNYTYTWTIPPFPSTTCLVKIKDHADGTISDISDATFSIILGNCKQYNIVILGSSSAAGVGPSSVDSAWVWRYSAYLGQKYSNFTVTNLAVPGYTTYDVLPSGNTDHNITKAMSYNPDAIIINLPTNDAANGYPVTTQLANYKTLSTIAGNAGVPIWISTSQPRNLNASGVQNLEDMRDSIQKIYGQFAIDFWSSVADPNGHINSLYDSGDGIHLNDAGHKLLFEQAKSKNIDTYILKTITVTSPNGGEQLEVGTQINITWTSTNVTSFDIDYSSDNGITWSTLATALSTNSYNWTIPSISSTNSLIRVKDHACSSTNDVSNATFTIFTKKLTVTSPNGGEQLEAGTYALISWTSAYVTSIDIDYSLDNGTSWISVDTSITAANSTYNWGIPAGNSTTCLIRIKDHSKASVSDVSDAVFTIFTKSLAITAPNGGEQLEAGKQVSINWTSAYISFVDIDYSYDNGVNWNSIAISILASNNTYTWTVPSTASNNCLIRIKDHADAFHNDISDAVFTIFVKAIAVAAPNGGEQLEVGKLTTITWSSANVTSVDIDYSSDNGATWASVATSVSGNSYNWTVPSTTSTTCLVRVKDHNETTVSDISNAVFTIFAKTLVVTAPNGVEQLEVGKQTTITWTSANVVSVDIDYSTNNGTSWNTVATSATGNSFSWTVPATPSATCLMRVKDHADATVADVSNAVFTIFAKSLAVTAPNGGEQLEVDKQTTITWTSANVVSVDIDYSADNGASWNTVAASVSANSYSWTVPATASTNCLIRVKDHTDTSVADISNAVFTIFAKSLAVTAPNGGEQLEVGKQTTITWTSVNVVSVDIDYSADNGASWNTVATSVSANSYSWTVPATPSATCLIKVKDHADATIFDISNAIFTIKITKSLTVTSPNGGEQMEVGKSATITWTSVNVTSVDIDYSSNNGLSWNSIATGVTTSSYNWTVPYDLSTTCLIKVKDHADASVSDISNAVFVIKITKSIAVTYPNGGEQLEVGTQMNIVWNSLNVTSVDIDYSSDNGSSWNSVATGVTASSYNWTVPSVLSTNCLIKVKDHTDATISDISNAVFTIKITKSIAVTYPNGGEQLEVGTQMNIVWNSLNVTSVDIDYSSDNGSSWNSVATGVNASSYNWTVPSVLSTNCLIKVKDHTDASVSDVSNALFTIKITKSIAVTYPNGGEQLVGGAQINIIWTSKNVTTVDIDYSLNNGTNWTTVATSVSASSYNWAVPAVSSTSCLVRVKDHANVTIIDASDAVFSITLSQTTVANSNVSVLDTTINTKKNSLIDDSNTLNIIVYPNPVIDNLNISSTNGSIINSIVIFNSMGVIVLEQNLNSSNGVIDIRSLAVGNYYLIIKDGDSMFTIKMIKQ